MNRYITMRMFPCDGCGRPIDPVRDHWFIDDDGCNVCAVCYDLQLAEAAAEAEAEWLTIEAELMTLDCLDDPNWRLEHAQNQT